MKTCQHYNCSLPATIQLKGEYLCEYHLEQAQKSSRDYANALFEQFCLDQKRIREASKWHEPYKVCLI